MYDVGCMITRVNVVLSGTVIVSYLITTTHTNKKNDRHTHKLNETENLYIKNNFIQHAINNVKRLKTWIYLIFFFCMMVMAH